MSAILRSGPVGGTVRRMDIKKGRYYIGKESDTGEPVLLKASSLTTHGVIFGMTGSGKTGLGVNVLEEALLNGTPTLILDPKGDMGNIMLNFPESTAEDLEPWMDAARAKRKGKTIAELAAKESRERREELASHGITPERIARLRDNTEFKIYTPGSSVGIGINVRGRGATGKPTLDSHLRGVVTASFGNNELAGGTVKSTLTLNLPIWHASADAGSPGTTRSDTAGSTIIRLPLQSGMPGAIPPERRCRPRASGWPRAAVPP